jgi:cardiolipin synthase
LATIILGRDASLAIAAIYYRFASLPAPKTFMRYWDFSLPSAEVHPTAVSKFNTFLQLAVIGSALTVPVLTDSILPAGLTTGQVDSALDALQYVVAATTLWSGGSYVWRKDVVKILGNDEELKKKQGFRGRAILGVSLASFLLLAVYAEQRKPVEPPVEEIKD